MSDPVLVFLEHHKEECKYRPWSKATRECNCGKDEALKHYRSVLAERDHMAKLVANGIRNTEELVADRDHLRMVVQMTVASQGWDGNDPDDAAWTTLYRLAREALEGGPGR